MLAAERRLLILDRLQEEKKVVVSELSARFGVSEETIRRDLDRLDKEGLAIKSYGGAVLNEANGTDMPFSVRKRRNMQGKRVIAEIIAGLVQDGEHIIVDPSTTAVSIVKALRPREDLTIITNSIEVLVELGDVSGWDVISTGGTLKKDYLALVGPRAQESIRSFNADKVILSCKGLDLEKGITDANELFAQIKETMLDVSVTKILAADYTKFNKVAFARICDVSEIDMVVTDVKPSDEWLRFFEQKGVECLYGTEDDGDRVCEQ